MKVNKDTHELEKEHQARNEWAAQEKLISQIHDDLLSLPLEARVKILSKFCVGCGVDNPNCGCCDDFCE